MIVEILLVATATAIAGAVAAWGIRRLRRLSLQLIVLALFAVLVPLTAVSLSGTVMLHGDDAGVVVLLSGVAAVAVSIGALVVARGIARPVRAVHDGAMLLAAGDFDTRVAATGPVEVSELAEAFNAMAHSLQQVFDARRDLIAWAAHDLRTPVTVLQAMLEAIEDDVASPERYLPVIAGRVRDLRRLIEDLFDLARAELEPQPDTAPHCDPVILTQRAMDSHQPQAAMRQINISLRTDLPELLVCCAPTDLGRVLDNLLANALQHAPNGGDVLIVVRRDGTLSISDNGPGFPPQHLSRVFDPFWRADVSRPDGGAGLGLAIARALIERNGGTITATNNPGAQVIVRCKPVAPSNNLVLT